MRDLQTSATTRVLAAAVQDGRYQQPARAGRPPLGPGLDPGGLDSATWRPAMWGGAGVLVLSEADVAALLDLDEPLVALAR